MHMRVARMMAVIAVFIAAAFLALPLLAQTPPASCAVTRATAVQCFVADAVTTGIVQPHDGMTLAQFQDYGVAVTKILQTDQTYLVLLGLSSAIADALPPKNADGTFDSAAQDAAVTQIVAAAATSGFVWPPSGTDLQDLQWFTQDIVNAMNVNQQVLQILTPGVGLRIIDSARDHRHRFRGGGKLGASQHQPDHTGYKLHRFGPGAFDAFAYYRPDHDVCHGAGANHQHLQSGYEPRVAIVSGAVWH